MLKMQQKNVLVVSSNYCKGLSFVRSELAVKTRTSRK